MKDYVPVHNKLEIFNLISCSSLFDSACSASVKPCTDVLVYPSFNVIPFSVQEVHKTLKTLDPRKPSGPDLIDPYLAADFVARPPCISF